MDSSRWWGRRCTDEAAGDGAGEESSRGGPLGAAIDGKRQSREEWGMPTRTRRSDKRSFQPRSQDVRIRDLSSKAARVRGKASAELERTLTQEALAAMTGRRTGNGR